MEIIIESLQFTEGCVSHLRSGNQTEISCLLKVTYLSILSLAGRVSSPQTKDIAESMGA